MFIQVIGHCWLKEWGQVFLFSKICFPNDQLIPQLHELDKISLSHCEILYQAKVSVVKFPELFRFWFRVFGIIFGPRKSTNFVLIISKVRIVYKNSLTKKAVVSSVKGFAR